jgi:hypothetical protein
VSAKCTEILGERVDGDGFHLYDSKGNGRTVALCSVHLDPFWPEWNMQWPCPHAQLSWERSRDGMRIHMVGCSFARMTWPWARNKTLLYLVGLSREMGYMFCKRCIPTVTSAEIILDRQSVPSPPESNS